MSSYSWFSANENGEVVAKTDVQKNGAINRYEYTVPDHIEKGHGDTRYDSMEDFINEKPSWSRDKNDAESIERHWKGNGYSLTINELLSIKEELISSRYYTSRKLLLKK
jgi:hypothetical protein